MRIVAHFIFTFTFFPFLVAMCSSLDAMCIALNNIYENGIEWKFEKWKRPKKNKLRHVILKTALIYQWSHGRSIYMRAQPSVHTHTHSHAVRKIQKESRQAHNADKNTEKHTRKKTNLLRDNNFMLFKKCIPKFSPVRYVPMDEHRFDDMSSKCSFAADECVTLLREKFGNAQPHGDANRDEVALQWAFFTFLSIFEQKREGKQEMIRRTFDSREKTTASSIKIEFLLLFASQRFPWTGTQLKIEPTMETSQRSNLVCHVRATARLSVGSRFAFSMSKHWFKWNTCRPTVHFALFLSLFAYIYLTLTRRGNIGGSTIREPDIWFVCVQWTFHSCQNHEWSGTNGNRSSHCKCSIALGAELKCQHKLYIFCTHFTQRAGIIFRKWLMRLLLSHIHTHTYTTWLNEMNVSCKFIGHI